LSKSLKEDNKTYVFVNKNNYLLFSEISIILRKIKEDLMEVSIIGKKYSGKTTLFDILTGLETDPFSIDIHEGMCEVPDERIEKLSGIFEPKKKIYAQFKMIDMPGVSKENFYSSNYLNKFKNSDALIYLLRTFENPQTPVDYPINPVAEIEQFEQEAIISELVITENRLEKLEAQMKKRKDKNDELEFKTLTKIKKYLEELVPLRSSGLTDDEKKIVRGFTFLSLKPVLFLLNCDEQEMELQDKIFEKYSLSMDDPNKKIMSICCKIEKEIQKLQDNEKAEYMSMYDLEVPGKNKVLSKTFELLDLICFLTYGKDEVRAWPIKKGLHAKLAAGTIHSDIEKGFIRAEIFAYTDFEKYGTISKLKENNLVRLEGKEYIMKDGDMVNFRFNI